MMQGKVIRDPVHGYVKLDSLALALVDTPQVQRLRWIRQLGLASLVYPGASHTRFEHSLGTYHLAKQMAENLGLDEEKRLRTGASALLHDVGHGPLSHASETALAPYIRSGHEMVLDVLRGSETRNVLNDHGLSPQDVQKAILGQTELGRIVSGEIDADRMDYLIRDSHYTGVAFGVVDHQRLMEVMSLHRGRLMVDEGGIHAAESLLLSRFLMQPTVYHHHVCRISECMLSAAMREMIENRDQTPQQIWRMDDHQLFQAMDAAGGYAAEILGRLRERRLFKRAVYVGRDSLERPRANNLRATVEEIAALAGTDPRYVLIDFPPPAEIREGSFPVRINGEIRELREVSPLVSALEKAHRQTWRFGIYTLPHLRESVGQAARRCLNIGKCLVQHTFDQMP